MSCIFLIIVDISKCLLSDPSFFPAPVCAQLSQIGEKNILSLYIILILLYEKTDIIK